MRLLPAILLSFALAAQEKPAEPAKAPSPAAEQWLTGEIEFGYRWNTEVAGNADSYRSIVNLGEGPKLFEMDWTIRNSSGRLFDTLNLRANSWGGDPYNTAHIDLRKGRAYNLNVDYRNLVYFNALPSFANPLVERGVLLNQRSFDMHRRLLDAELELLPGRRVVPYLAYGRDWGTGRGVTDFVSDGNEYPVANHLRDRTNNFRGGVRLELSRLHVTLEQGEIRFKDHQRVFTRDLNFGNRTTTLFGQRLLLSNLEQFYGVQGESSYSKALFTANPAPWFDVYGQFLYSKPETDVRYSQANAGNIAVLETLSFFTGQNVLATSEAKQPHASGSFGFEVRPFQRLRIIESLMTDRFHISGAALLNETLTSLSPPSTVTNTESIPAVTPVVMNYHRQEFNLLVDVTSRLTLRGGHRYVWGDAQARSGQLSQTGAVESNDQSMHVGLAGMTLRAVDKLTLQFDGESSSARRSYFRTSLHNYRKGRIRGRYQALASLSLGLDYSILDNDRPAPYIRSKFQHREASASVMWTPWGGKWFSVLGDYTRSTLRSDLAYLVPNTLRPAASNYRDNSHSATAMLDVKLPQVNQESPKLSFGGSLFSSSGSRPTRYYQPVGRFSFPLYKKTNWFAEWRWYNLGEPFYLYEGFRTHHFVTGLRLAL